MAKHTNTASDESDHEDVRTARKAKPRGRPKSATESIAKAIYFRDAGQIDKLEEIVRKHPDGSVSRIIQQLVAEFCKHYEAKPPEDRKLVFTATVYL